MKCDGKDTRNEDLELVAACIEGDLDSFEFLVSKYQKRMLNIAFRMLGSYEDACDIVQDAFVAAYRGLKKFERRSSFSTWLHTIVINHARNRLKQLKLKKQREFSINTPVMTENGNIGIEIATGEPSVLERIEKKNVHDKVQECIERLDSEFREVIILRDIQEFSYDEIREILQIPGGTVKSRLSRAREAVRDCLKGIMGGL
jgi:RNA polymerase sigma-70 factor (ECF subfamily)